MNRRPTFDTDEDESKPELPEPVTGQRKRREILKCPHTDRKHYAKNMCHNCYHRKGKTKMATKCGHTDRSHYSSGMCQNCYLAKYYLKRKEKAKAKAEEKAQTAQSSTAESCVSMSASPEREEAPKMQKLE